VTTNVNDSLVGVQKFASLMTAQIQKWCRSYGGMPDEHECGVEKKIRMFELRWRVSRVVRKLQEVRDDAGFQKQGFMSCNQGNGCIEKKLLFTQGRSTQYLGHVKFLACSILLGFQAGSQHRFVLFSFGCVGFGCRCLGTVLGYISRIATKEEKIVIESILMFLRCQFTIFAKLQ